MKDLPKLTQAAKQLIAKNPRLFAAPEKMTVAWLLYDGRCGYCGHNFFAGPWAFFGGIFCTDHLLPKSKYPQLSDCLLNFVLCCRPCNDLKWNWDPNTAMQPLVYKKADGSNLSEKQHKILFARALQRVKEKRAAKEKEFEEALCLWREAKDSLEIVTK